MSKSNDKRVWIMNEKRVCSCGGRIYKTTNLCSDCGLKLRPKRVVLGEGYSWFSGNGQMVIDAKLTKVPMESKAYKHLQASLCLVGLRNSHKVGNKKIRLIAEILED